MASNFVRKWPLLSVLLTAVVGGVLAFYSTSLTYKVSREGLASPGGCSINEWISCDAVYSTSYATFLGIPVAWWGFLFYLWIAAAGLFMLFTKKEERLKNTAMASSLMSLAAVLFSFYKAYHLIALDVLCPVCVGMYIVNIAIFILLLKAANLSFANFFSQISAYFKTAFGKKAELSFSPQPVLFLALITSLFSLGYIGVQSYQSAKSQDEDIDRAVETHFAQPQQSIRIAADAAVWGNPDAELSLIEFSDFQCPGCQYAAFHLRSVLFEYRDRVRVFFMNYPLDTSINPHPPRNIHPFAGLAARAGVCAQKFGDFWDYHDDLFQNQNKLSRPLMLDLAKQRGWDVAQFESCLDDSATVQRVRSDIALAKEAGVRSTPTLFINGRLAKFWNSDEFIRKVVKRELEALDEQ